MDNKVVLRIVLPFPLPTWNRLLACHPWQRKKIRDWIHRAVCACTSYRGGDGCVTLMVSAQKLLLMGLSCSEFAKMIRPKK